MLNEKPSPKVPRVSVSSERESDCSDKRQQASCATAVDLHEASVLDLQRQRAAEGRIVDFERRPAPFELAVEFAVSARERPGDTEASKRGTRVGGVEVERDLHAPGTDGTRPFAVGGDLHVGIRHFETAQLPGIATGIRGDEIELAVLRRAELEAVDRDLEGRQLSGRRLQYADHVVFFVAGITSFDRRAVTCPMLVPPMLPTGPGRHPM
jgi:hypothetical protein